MMADPLPQSATLCLGLTLTRQEFPNDPEHCLGCKFCNRQLGVAWIFSYKISGARITSGLCENCRLNLRMIEPQI